MFTNNKGFNGSNCFPVLKELFDKTAKAPPIKNVCSQGGVAQCGHFSDKGEGFFRCGHSQFLVQISGFFEIDGVSARARGEGVLQIQTSAIFGANLGFFEIYGVSARARGLASADI